MSTPISRAMSNEASVFAGASALAPPCPILWQTCGFTAHIKIAGRAADRAAPGFPRPRWRSRRPGGTVTFAPDLSVCDPQDSRYYPCGRREVSQGLAVGGEEPCQVHKSVPP